MIVGHLVTPPAARTWSPMARQARRAALLVGKHVFVRTAALISAFLLAGAVFALDGILIGASDGPVHRRVDGGRVRHVHCMPRTRRRRGLGRSWRVGRARGADRRPGGDDGRATFMRRSWLVHGLGMIRRRPLARCR